MQRSAGPAPPASLKSAVTRSRRPGYRIRREGQAVPNFDFGGVFQWDPQALGMIVLRTLGVFFALFIGIRLAGKRELGQMAPFDIIVILVISNAVQNAMVGPDTSLNGGLVAAFTLLIMNWSVNAAGLRWHWLGRRTLGTPTLLISDGAFVEEHLRREGIQKDEVMMALREHGFADVGEVGMAVLEIDGTISVVPRHDGVMRTRHRLRGRKLVG